MKWKPIALAIAPIAFLGPFVPTLFADLEANGLLRLRGMTTSGVVSRYYQPMGSGRGCRTLVDVTYEVALVRYVVSSKACGVPEAQLPVGRKLDVRYLPSDPSVSEVIAPWSSIETRRTGSGQLILVALVCFVVWWAAVQEWRRAR